MIAAQKHSVCSAEHLSNLPFAKQALTAWLVMFQRAFFIPWSHKNSIDIFLNLHNISHPGRLATRHLVSSRFVWRGLSSNITAWTQSYLCCQQGKIHPHFRLLPLPIPSHDITSLIFTLI
jgi:hypothetical protein